MAQDSSSGWILLLSGMSSWCSRLTTQSPAKLCEVTFPSLASCCQLQHGTHQAQNISCPSALGCLFFGLHPVLFSRACAGFLCSKAPWKPLFVRFCSSWDSGPKTWLKSKYVITLTVFLLLKQSFGGELQRTGLFMSRKEVWNWLLCRNPSSKPKTFGVNKKAEASYSPYLC